MPKFAISIIGMRRPEGSKAALETMLRHAEDCYVFATANGCPATARAFRELAEKHPNLTVTENVSNEGFQKPHAQQFHEAAVMGCEYCLIANDDISVPEKFLTKLAEPMESDPQVAITGPEGNCTHLTEGFHGTGGKGDPEYIEMSCGLIRISAISALRSHLWCPGLRFVYSEDSSLSLFVREKGYTVKTVPMHVGHIRSVTVNGDPETKRICEEAQIHNHKVNCERWAYYFKHGRKFTFPIVLHRSYAIGDVLLTTPVIRAIAKSNPLSPIYVVTNYPELFERSPYATGISAKDKNGSDAIPADALCIELDGAYEDRTMVHIVHAYEETVRRHLPGLGKVDLKTDIFPSKDDLAWGADTKRRLLAKSPEKKLACIGNDTTTWTGKNWLPDRFHQVRENLHAQGYVTVSVGTKKPEVRTTIHQLAALLAVSDLFVGHDSLPLHLAQAAGCPTVGLFGATSARFILTQGSKAAAAEADKNVPCAGERHRITGKTYTPCDGACMRSIEVEHVMGAISKLNVV